MIKLKDVASLVGGKLTGDGELEVTGLGALDEAGQGEIAFILSPEWLRFLGKSRASCVIVPRGVRRTAGSFISVEDPFTALLKMADLLFPKSVSVVGRVHPTSVVEQGVSLGQDVAIGALSYVGEDAKIGARTVIHAQVYIGGGVSIGEECEIYPQVTVREGVEIGSRVTIHPGAVIGSDGFGFIPKEGAYHKIPSLGKVIIEDDVEIGANAGIDRATFGATKIGRGSKLDNLVQIGHNVTIGENCILVAQVGIGGSTNIGDNAVLGGQAGLVDHLNIGDNVKIGAQAGVTKSIPPNVTVSGYPARRHQDAMRIYAATQKLPELLKRVKKLEEKLGRSAGKSPLKP